MIVTLTPNTGLDYTLAVPELRLNATVRSSAQAWGMAGKAADVAWILGALGEPVLALGFAAGPLGKRMEAMLQARNVCTDFTWVEGESRLNVVVVCSDGSGQSTFTGSGLRVSPGQVADLLEKYESALEKAGCAVLGGSLPDGAPPAFYPQAIGMARRRGVPVIFDAGGPWLKEGMQAFPSLIKPNRDELAELTGEALHSPGEVIAAIRQVHHSFGVDIIATLGIEGALAILGENCYRIPALALPVASAAGAGDGVLAGMALALARGEPPENGLRYGFALAGAVVQTLETAGFRLEDYQALLPRVEIQRL